MTSLRFGYWDIDSQLRLFGTEGCVLTFDLPAGAIHSALIYDDGAVIRYTDPNGRSIINTMSLWRGWQDVLEATKLRLVDSTSPTGYTYIPFSFARGTPDLTPVKLVGTKGDDVLCGGMGADVLKGGKGNDILHGERTSDNHWVGGDDKLIGGSGDDTLYGYRGDDLLKGGSGADSLYGGKGDDRLDGGSGADHLDGGKGNDELEGKEGNDILHGDDGHDRLDGWEGADKLYGDAGHDHLVGGSGDDVLDGGTGDDILTGGKGADVFVLFDLPAHRRHDWDQVTDFELGIDRVQIDQERLSSVNIEAIVKTVSDGQNGDKKMVSHILITDLITIHYPDYPGFETKIDSGMKLDFEDISVLDFGELVVQAGGLAELITKGLPDSQPGSIVGTNGDDNLWGTQGDDKIYGLGGNDTLVSYGGRDKLYGGSGDDQLIGHEDKDQLYGGSGEDWLDGGQGNDVLTGGGGADIFHINLKYAPVNSFKGTPIDNHDRVTDFELGIDKIGLVSSQYHDAGLQIETQSSNGLVTGVRMSISQSAGNNSLSVRFDTAVTQAEFDDYVGDAGGLNAFLLEVV